MTDSSYWKSGGHNGFEAGDNLTEAIKNISPHGIKNFKIVPEIGILVEKN
jgi:predicted heme/steroid binding protein